MYGKYFSIFLAIFAVAKANNFVAELLSASDHETNLNEDLARLLEVDFERQGTCGAQVKDGCCVSCGYDGSCYNGGYCCELNKVRTRLLKHGRSECPRSWASECKTTKLVPIESCPLARKHHGSHKSRKGSDSDSGSGSDEDRASVRLMCLCLTTKRCCSGFGTRTVPTTTAATTTDNWWGWTTTQNWWGWTT